MRLFRLGTRQHPIRDGAGAALVGGRWNPAGMPVIYASGSLALAMLERLVQRRSLDRTLFVAVDVPDDLGVTDLLAHPPAGWWALSSASAMQAGSAWLHAAETALLRVPSAIVPIEANYVVNPRHPDAARLHVAEPVSLDWDLRLFGIPPPVAGV